MEKFLVLLVVLLFIYNLLKPKKKQGKGNASAFQDLQKLLSNMEQQNKTVNTKTANHNKTPQKQNTVVKTETDIVLEKTNIEVKTYDNVKTYDDISLSEYLETKKRSSGFEDLEKSDYYAENDIGEMDTDISFNKEDEKWLNQSIKDNADHSDKHTRKAKFTAKDIKKAYITNQILEKKYI